jgi:hypothetical protein
VIVCAYGNCGDGPHTHQDANTLLQHKDSDSDTDGDEDMGDYLEGDSDYEEEDDDLDEFARAQRKKQRRKRHRELAALKREQMQAEEDDADDEGKSKGALRHLFFIVVVVAVVNSAHFVTRSVVLGDICGCMYACDQTYLAYRQPGRVYVCTVCWISGADWEAAKLRRKQRIAELQGDLFVKEDPTLEFADDFDADGKRKSTRAGKADSRATGRVGDDESEDEFEYFYDDDGNLQNRPNPKKKSKEDKARDAEKAKATLERLREEKQTRFLAELKDALRNRIVALIKESRTQRKQQQKKRESNTKVLKKLDAVIRDKPLVPEYDPINTFHVATLEAVLTELRDLPDIDSDDEADAAAWEAEQARQERARLSGKPLEGENLFEKHKREQRERLEKMRKEAEDKAAREGNVVAEADSAAAALQLQELQSVLMARLKRIWDVCEYTAAAKLMWLEKYAQVETTMSLPHALTLAEECVGLIVDRENAMYSLREYERKASDPRRLFYGKAADMLREEKMRKMYFRRVYKVSNRLIWCLQDLRLRFGDILEFRGACVYQDAGRHHVFVVMCACITKIYANRY